MKVLLKKIRSNNKKLLQSSAPARVLAKELPCEDGNENSRNIGSSSSPKHLSSSIQSDSRIELEQHRRTNSTLSQATSSTCILDEDFSLSEETNSFLKRSEPSLSFPSLPPAGSSTTQVDESWSPAESHNNDTTADSNNESNQQQQQPKGVRWRKVSGDTLQVRSAGYRISRVKTSSPGELYECLGVDFIESSHRLPEMSSRVELPEVYFDAEAEDVHLKSWYAPDLFVITLSIPIDPSARGDDGRCYTMSLYLRMKDETRQILKQLTHHDHKDGTEANTNNPRINAVRLFNEWCRKAPQDPQMQARFKLIPFIANLSEWGIPSWITRWSGKPILIKRAGKTGFVYNHQREHTNNNNNNIHHHFSSSSCMEMEISLHPFPWATKQAVALLKDQIFSQVLTTFGFVIEGRDDAELPEVLIGTLGSCMGKTRVTATRFTFSHTLSFVS